MANFRMENDIFYDVKSGTATIHGDTDGELKSYAVLVKGGHCGTGYYIPIILTISTKNKETALKMAENIGRVKKTAKHTILAITEINQLEYYALEYINDCDPYFNNTHNTELMPEVFDRRVIVETFVDKERVGTKHRKGELVSSYKPNYTKVPKELVKTADQYEEKYVLQRHVAPSFYGTKLVFPKRINLKSFLNEYLEQNLYELGMRQMKASAVSFYYQIFGLHNRPGLYYKDKCLVFYDENGQKQYIKVPDAMAPHLAKAKRKFMEEEEKKLAEKEAENNSPTPVVVLASKRDAFNRRYAKYQKMLDDKVKQ